MLRLLVLIVVGLWPTGALAELWRGVLTADGLSIDSGATYVLQNLPVNSHLYIGKRVVIDATLLGANTLLVDELFSHYWDPPNYSGTRRALVIVYKSVNDSEETKAAQFVEDLRKRLPEISEYFQKVSFNQLNIEFTISALHSVTYKTSCAPPTDSELERVDSEIGQDVVAGYEHVLRMYLHRCSSDGTGAEPAGRETKYFISTRTYELNSPTIVHEMLHNLGLGHSSAIHCGPDETRIQVSSLPPEDGAQCASKSYGEYFDTMGSATLKPALATLHSFHRYVLGFIGEDRVPKITRSGIYEIVPLESSLPGAKALRIKHGRIDNTSLLRLIKNFHHTYDLWIEYRQPLSTDSSLAAESKTSIEGAILRLTPREPVEVTEFSTFKRPNWFGTELIYAGTNLWEDDEFALLPGQSFLDRDNGVTVKVLGRTRNLRNPGDSKLIIQICFPGDECAVQAMPPFIIYRESGVQLQAGKRRAQLRPKNLAGKISNCKVSPSLPQGLSLKKKNCTISGKATKKSKQRTYTITASNKLGATKAFISIGVDEVSKKKRVR